jgi:hypothetical protein
MNFSSLPDIFRKASTEQLLVRKQGGQFSLHLTSQSVEKYIPSRAGYAPGDQTYVSLSGGKRRSSSSTSVQPKPSIIR